MKGRAGDRKRSPANRRLFGPVDHNQNKLDADDIWNRLSENSRTRVDFSPSFRRRTLSAERSDSDAESESRIQVGRDDPTDESPDDVCSRPRYTVQSRPRGGIEGISPRNELLRREDADSSSPVECQLEAIAPRSGIVGCSSALADGARGIAAGYGGRDARPSGEPIFRELFPPDRSSDVKEKKDGTISSTTSSPSPSFRSSSAAADAISRVTPGVLKPPAPESALDSRNSPSEPSSTCCLWRPPVKLANVRQGEHLDLRRPQLRPGGLGWHGELQRRPLHHVTDVPDDPATSLREETTNLETEIRRIPVVQLLGNETAYSQMSEEKCFFKPITTDAPPFARPTGSPSPEDEESSKDLDSTTEDSTTTTRKRRLDDADADGPPCGAESAIRSGSEMFSESNISSGTLSRRLTEKLRDIAIPKKNKTFEGDDQTPM